MTLEYWNKMRQPPPSALRLITAGRLKGMTDIKPQWRYQILTEIFGPCGFGWYEDEPHFTYLDGEEGQRFVTCKIALYVKIGDEWSKPIWGVGGDMPIKKERSGLYHNDEAEKMAFTDAAGARRTDTATRTGR